MTEAKKKILNAFFTRLSNKLEELFPKGECQERGQAMILNAEANIAVREALDEYVREIVPARRYVATREVKKMLEAKESLFSAVGIDVIQKQSEEVGWNACRQEILKRAGLSGEL